jgi:DNA modification methylase
MHNFIETPICMGNERTEHPTQKPLLLIEKLLTIHSNPNDLILDPFLGSGSTAVAAVKLNRRFIGIEISPKYCQIARERIAREQEQQSLYTPTPTTTPVSAPKSPPDPALFP